VTAVTAAGRHPALHLRPSPQNAADEIRRRETKMRRPTQTIAAIALNLCVVSFVGVIFAHSFAPFLA
jgi:hypothetical protein